MLLAPHASFGPGRRHPVIRALGLLDRAEFDDLVNRLTDADDH